MLQTTCACCAQEIRAPLDQADTEVRCPGCDSRVRLPSLFGGTTPRPQPSPLLDRREEPVDIATASGQRPPVISQRALGWITASALGLVALLGWALWALLAPNFAEAPRPTPAQPAAAAPVAVQPPPSPQDAGRTWAAPPRLPARPANTGIDLLGSAAMAHGEFHNMALSGGTIFATGTAERPQTAAYWNLAAVEAGPVLLDAWVALARPADPAVADASLQIVIPVAPDRVRAVQLPCPADGTFHRLRIWADPDNAVEAAIDDSQLAGQAIVPLSAGPAIRGLSIATAEAPGLKIGAAVLLGQQAWTGRSDIHRNTVDARSAAPQITDIAGSFLTGSTRPADGTYRAYDPGTILDPCLAPVAAAESWPHRLALCLGDLVGRRLRPVTQTELDLAARLIWLAKQADPGDAAIRALEESLLRAGVEAPPAADPAARQADALDELIDCAQHDALPGGRILLDDLLWYLAPFRARSTAERVAQHAHADSRLDWPRLSALARPAPADDVPDPLVLSRRYDGTWAYSPLPEAALEQAVLPARIHDGNGLRAAPALDRRILALRVKDGGLRPGDAVCDPGCHLWGDGAIAAEVYGGGQLRVVALVDPGAPLLSIAVDAMPAGGLDPALVYSGLDTGHPAVVLAAQARDAAQSLTSVDPRQAFQPLRVWIERSDGRVSWRTSGARPTQGTCSSTQPLALVIEPAPGPGLRVIRCLARSTPPAPAKRRPDALAAGLLPGPWTWSGTAVPRLAPERPILALAPAVLDAGARARLTVFTSDELKPGDVLWAIDPTEQSPFAAASRIIRDARWTPMRITENRDPRDRRGSPGFRLVVAGPAAEPAPAWLRAADGVTVRAYGVSAEAPCAGRFQVVANDRLATPSAQRQNAPVLIVLPAGSRREAAAWARLSGDRDGNGRGDLEDLPLPALLHAVCADWCPELVWSAPGR